MPHSILIVDDLASFRKLYELTLREAGFETVQASSAEEALKVIKEKCPDMVVSDVRMEGADGLELLQEARKLYPHLPFLLVTAYANVRSAVSALKLGAVDYLAKPIDLDELLAAVKDELNISEDWTEEEIPAELLDGVIATSPVMQSLLYDAYRVANSDVTILLTGESGTGKDEIARFIHRASDRVQGPFVAVNCAAISGSLLASELFGHTKGAFTGATSNRMGKFREAKGGTLFLDEIGDMPLDLQPALLRALENGTITPVGSDKEVSLDYRLIAATNSNLEAAVAENKFRSDLYYRLNVINLALPPLRQRTEDIIPLANHFLAKAARGQKRLSRAAAQAMHAYCWPGNVRELANAMKRAALLARTEMVMPNHLPPAMIKDANPSTAVAVMKRDEATSLEESERDTIIRALKETNGNKTQAAKILKITRRGLIYKLKRLGIDDFHKV